jgi:para-aminobenzoate synthetase/4-amino-4-deoxychorismate lyase
VGVIRPGGSARFNVPIRTVTLRDRRAHCGIGSGITWGSTSEGEWSEWQHKSAFLDQASRPFELLQTLRVQAGECRHLELHLKRLIAAGAHFGFPVDHAAVRRQVLPAVREGSASDARVRILVDCRGRARVEVSDLPANPTEPVRVRLAPEAIRAPAAFLRHKTTRREHYERLDAGTADVFDTLLWNTRGEVTEFTRGSIIIERRDGTLVTPPLHCGALDGVGRELALECDGVGEEVVKVAELADARRLWFVNSMRGWIEVRLENTSS